MSFDKKSIESYEAAKELYYGAKYNSCVNRIYYCMYDLILDKLYVMKKFDNVETLVSKNVNNHKNTITYFLDNLIKKKLSTTDYNSAWSSINAAKTARHKADYTPELISEKNAKSIIKHGERFREIVNKVC